MIGEIIAQNLIASGYTVRVLTRRSLPASAGIEYVVGDLSNVDVLKSFLAGADYVFHCAAEISNSSLMCSINVNATAALLDVCKLTNIKYLCFISSAGVIGLTTLKVVDETATCNPQNDYEITKWQAESLVSKGIPGTSVVILRPTNVISLSKPGAFLMPMVGGWVNRLKVFVKGGECAHLVHSHDVASAALFFMGSEYEHPECFFVSRDDDPSNTVAGVWTMYDRLRKDRSAGGMFRHLPYWVPCYLRRLAGKRSNVGDVIYSADKLRRAGYKFKYDVQMMAKELVEKNG